MYDRRQVLAGGAALLSLLAGCGSSGGGNGDGSGGGGGGNAVPGETRTLSGLRITLTDVVETRTLDVVAQERRENVTRTALETTAFTAGTNEIGNQRRFIVTHLTVENPTDEPTELPAPQPSPPAAAGEILITGTGQGVTPLVRPIDLVRDGRPVDSFGEAVADLNWTLAPGNSVSGWLLFRVAPSFDRTTNTLSVEVHNSFARWTLKA